MILLYQFGQEKPLDELVELMLLQARDYKCARNAVFKYDFIQPAPIDGSARPSWDKESWIIVEPELPAPGYSMVPQLMVESCKSQLEGIILGYALGRKPIVDAEKAKAHKQEQKRREKYWRLHRDAEWIDYIKSQSIEFEAIPAEHQKPLGKKAK